MGKRLDFLRIEGRRRVDPSGFLNQLPQRHGSRNSDLRSPFTELQPKCARLDYIQGYREAGTNDAGARATEGPVLFAIRPHRAPREPCHPARPTSRRAKTATRWRCCTSAKAPKPTDHRLAQRLRIPTLTGVRPVEGPWAYRARRPEIGLFADASEASLVHKQDGCRSTIAGA